MTQRYRLAGSLLKGRHTVQSAISLSNPVPVDKMIDPEAARGSSASQGSFLISY